MKRISMVIKLFSVLLILGIVSNAVTQIQKGMTRPLTTEQWMEGVIQPHCKAIKKGLEANLLEDKAWNKLAVNAAVLNESSCRRSLSRQSMGYCGFRNFTDRKHRTFKSY